MKRNYKPGQIIMGPNADFPYRVAAVGDYIVSLTFLKGGAGMLFHVPRALLDAAIDGGAKLYREATEEGAKERFTESVFAVGFFQTILGDGRL